MIKLGKMKKTVPIRNKSYIKKKTYQEMLRFPSNCMYIIFAYKNIVPIGVR